MPVPPFSREHAARVADPRLSAEFQRWLRRKAPKFEVADLVQAVLTELLPYPDPPQTVEGLMTLGKAILKNKVTDILRRAGRIKDIEVMQRDDEVDEKVAAPVAGDAWDPIDQKKRVQVVEELVTDRTLTPDDVQVLAHADAEGFRALAEQRGTSVDALRRRAQRNRILLKEHWGRYASIGGVLAVALIITYGYFHRDNVVLAPPPVMTPVERANAMRDDARRSCAAEHWKDCWDELEESRYLDPAGDTPELQALRKVAADKLDSQ